MKTSILEGIQLVIFDFDGLLVNSEEIIQMCWQKTCEFYSYDLPSDYFDNITGVSKDTTFQNIESFLNIKIDYEEFFNTRTRFINQEIENGNIRLMNGVQQFLELLASKNISMGIATSSSNTWPANLIKRLGVENFFSFIVGREDVREVKPHPDLYLKALKLGNVTKDRVLIFEDSIPGIIAAEAAGIVPIVINSSKAMKGKIMDQNFSGLILDSFNELCE